MDPFETFKAQYLVGIDGLSPIGIVTGILGFCAVSPLKISFREREYLCGYYLARCCYRCIFFIRYVIICVLGSRINSNVFLISIWGSGKAQYSAMKFLIFTLTSGAFFLIGILSVYFATGTFVM